VARACVAAQKGATERLLALGTVEVIDHDTCSFSLVFGGRKTQPLDVVLDCVGVEAASALVREVLGAAYSVASPALCSLEEEGALELVRRWWGGRQSEAAAGEAGHAAGAATRIWAADALATSALCEVLRFIEDGKVTPPPEANAAAELAGQYAEYLSWARGTETGLRFGFPGLDVAERGGAAERALARTDRRQHEHDEDTDCMLDRHRRQSDGPYLLPRTPPGRQLSHTEAGRPRCHTRI